MGIAQGKGTILEKAASAVRALRDLIVQRWPIDRLIPYARNSRTHSEEQVAQAAITFARSGCSAKLPTAFFAILAGRERRYSRFPPGFLPTLNLQFPLVISDSPRFIPSRRNG